jgi:hypothetical protein
MSCQCAVSAPGGVRKVFEDPADRGCAGLVAGLEQLALDPLVSPAVVLGGEVAARRPWRPATGQAGSASRRPGRRSGRTGKGARVIIMPHGHASPVSPGHRSRPTFGTRQARRVAAPGRPAQRLDPRSPRHRGREGAAARVGPTERRAARPSRAPHRPRGRRRTAPQTASDPARRQRAARRRLCRRRWEPMQRDLVAFAGRGSSDCDQLHRDVGDDHRSGTARTRRSAEPDPPGQADTAEDFGFQARATHVLVFVQLPGCPGKPDDGGNRRAGIRAGRTPLTSYPPAVP